MRHIIRRQYTDFEYGYLSNDHLADSWCEWSEDIDDAWVYDTDVVAERHSKLRAEFDMLAADMPDIDVLVKL